MFMISHSEENIIIRLVASGEIGTIVCSKINIRLNKINFKGVSSLVTVIVPWWQWRLKGILKI